MKKVILSVLAVAALASCVQNEVVNPQQAIDFGTPLVSNTTKATDPSYGQNGVALTAFNVYGTVEGSGNGVVNIFDGALVEGSIGQNVWSCDVKQYWIPGATYNFAAVVDATVGKNANNMPETLTTVANDEDYLKDMLYAFNGPITAGETNDAVNFNFKHLLAKAQFVVTSTTEEGYYYNVEEIKINNFASGTYTIATKLWNKGEAKAYVLGSIEDLSAANTNVTSDKQVLLIPTATAFTVEYLVKLYNSNGTADKTDDVLLRTIDKTSANAQVVEIKNNNDEIIGIQGGYAYNFNLALTAGSEIQFTVTDQPTWADGGANL